MQEEINILIVLLSADEGEAGTGVSKSRFDLLNNLLRHQTSFRFHQDEQRYNYFPGQQDADRNTFQL